MACAHDTTPRVAARILIIDDEPAILSFVARALRGHGFGVDCAPDGSLGLKLTRSGDYGLVLLDLVMPGLDGIATLKAIMAARPEQAVMVLSGRTDVEARVRSLDLGAADYLGKPFALAELLARVRTRLRLVASPGNERFIRVGSVTLDLQRRIAEAGAGEVALSGREFKLLLHLMRRAGTVSSREELLAEVWDTPFDPGTNVVDVYIRRLRCKLGRDTIETLRNLGYALRFA